MTCNQKLIMDQGLAVIMTSSAVVRSPDYIERCFSLILDSKPSNRHATITHAT